MTAEQCKVLTDKNLQYSIVKATPSVPLIFLKTEKIESENFYFVLSSSSFSQCITQKIVRLIKTLYTLNDCYTIIDIFLV